MDPARHLLHLGLSTTDAVLSRTLDVVRLVDGLVVATASPAREEGAPSAWPDPEEGDLGAASEALLARQVSVHPPHIRDAARRSVNEPAKTTAEKTAPAKKAAPAKKTAARKAPAKRAAAKKSASAASAAKKAPAKRTGAKKTAATKKTAAARSATKKAPAEKTPSPKADS
ncbi:hypothetical protein [Janibacter sp. GXQ6167]|uniref:hypothetical protein n=1 Tax=Janibacter sp. GXQ6167 TaxID=3240791 RepID=UPI0035262A99